MDPRIALGVQPLQLENPVNQLARVMQVQGMQDQQRMNRLQAQQIEQGMTEQNALSTLMREPGFDLSNPESQRKLLATSPGKAGALLKSHAELQNTRQTGEKQRFELAEKGYQAFRATGSALYNDPAVTKQSAVAATERLVTAGLLRREVWESMVQTLPEDPTQLRATLKALVTEQLPADKALTIFAPTPEKVDDGQTISYRDKNPLSPTYGQGTAGGVVQKQMTPGEVATDARGREQLAISKGQLDVSRGNLGVSRDRLELERGNSVADAGGPNQVALVKRYGKPPKDYRWKDDGTVEAIPGGPADIKSGEVGAKMQAKADASIRGAESVLKEVADAKGMVGMFTTGLGSVAKVVPGTPAKNLEAKLTSIKANLGFDRLQQMRDNSPTGGALGQVAVQELVALQSTVASLDQAQSPEQLTAALEKIEKHYNNWLDVMRKAQSEKPASGGPKPGTVQDGYRFKGGNPADQSNWEKV